MIKLSIIMVSWNDYRNTNNRLIQFTKMIDKEMELIWVDNASTENEFLKGKRFWIDAYQKLGFNLSVYSMKSNVGFQEGYNFGVEKAKGTVYIITQPDVVFSDLNLFKAIKNSNISDKLILGGRLIGWDGGWNKVIDDDGNTFIIPYLEGWLLVLSKKIWQDIGGFDLQYFPADMEDIDFSLTALSKGYELAEIEPKVFSHIGGQSFSSSSVSGNARLERTKINKNKFDEKWKSKLKFIFGGK